MNPQSQSQSRTGAWWVLVVVIVAGAALVQWRTAPETSRLENPRRVLRSALELRDGILHEKETGKPFSGVLTESYPDGAPLSRSELVDGRLHGVSEGWYANRQIQVREHFVRGIASGERIKWHPNGIVQSRANIANGQWEGIFRRWHENGALAEEVPMRQGRPVGTSRSYYPSGCLQSQVTLQDGAVKEQRFWKDGEVPKPAEEPVAAVSRKPEPQL